MKGEIHNSMFQPNSVSVRVSKGKMEKFYEDSRDLSSQNVSIKPNAMRRYSVGNTLNKGRCSLIIEI